MNLKKDLILELVDYCYEMIKFHYAQSETYIPDSDMCRYHEIKAECYSDILKRINVYTEC